VDSDALDVESVALRAVEQAEARSRSSLRRAINATGVILHTGLGRAVLSAAALQAVIEVGSGHSTLEIDPELGSRGSRQDHVSALLTSLTGAESALALNNNAGATFLAVAALAAGREVIISRGELVEIGGAFRMPDIIRASGAGLVEVGTTNRTRLSDYESAITERTGLILKCHPSNFKQLGFTEVTSTAELVTLGRQAGVPVMDDLGSGAMVDTAALGGPSTVTLRQAVATGCDVVTASGDKLLGGPQAGIVLGTAGAVTRIAAHPLARALRLDKLTLAALEATLKLYVDNDGARREIPTLRYMARTPGELHDMADRLARLIHESCANVQAEVVPESSQVGGGSLPGEDLPTFCVSVRACDATLTATALARRLRAGSPPVFGRIHADSLLLDPRTLEEDELSQLAKALNSAATPIR
jgi:L-seryl-tRNA(Ser) seleniumtransferase